MIADWLGIDDGSERIEWRYAQRIDRKTAPHVVVDVA
jgi:CRISPR/Cas system CSM-associated protein Csm3 (group 7 of RAMP superfamily)